MGIVTVTHMAKQAKRPKPASLYLQPAFLSCVLVLLMSGVGMSVMVRGLGGYLEKEPLPLARSLELLDEQALYPFRVVSRQRIENDEVLASLGTQDYIQWVLEDPQAGDHSATKRVMLFVTYYPLPDRVPHVPEECYMGAGFQRLATDTFTLSPQAQRSGGTLRARYLVFGGPSRGNWQSSVRVPVVYLFRVNGRYAANRDEARVALNRNIFGKSSYFSKVELVFNQGTGTPSKEETVDASQRLLALLLPILERDHWPAEGDPSIRE